VLIKTFSSFTVWAV